MHRDSAVVVFFVPSGFFVSGSVLRASAQQRFTWRGYLAEWGTRLWMVILRAVRGHLALDRNTHRRTTSGRRRGRAARRAGDHRTKLAGRTHR